jgi:hypothetical protein
MATLNTPAGDGGLRVNLDAYGSFGSRVGGSTSDAFYDPVDEIDEAGTMFDSGVAFRLAGEPTRSFLTTGSIGGSGGLNDPGFLQETATNADSTFTIGNLNFTLNQTVDELFAGTERNGSTLVQTYTITNTGSETVPFELIRYADGDLLFDGTLRDSGGRLFKDGQEILFETDSGEDPQTATTFVGITAFGGNSAPPGRIEVDSYPGLRGRIIDGVTLDGTITGDGPDADEFIESSPYDVTLALRNDFVLAPGETTRYITSTIFGSGAPEDVVPVALPVPEPEPEPISEPVVGAGGSIQGTKWNDLNGDRVQNPDEPGLAGVTIYLDLNDNGVLDADEPSRVTEEGTGRYAFTGLPAGTYTVREVVPDGSAQTFPGIASGEFIGTNSPAEGNVNPTAIDLNLSPTEVATEIVSLTLPQQGAIAPNVDVFLLFDDTGSFEETIPTVVNEFPRIIDQLQTELPSVNFGFGVGRLEDFGGEIGTEIGSEDVDSERISEIPVQRPFVLGQPIITTDTPGFEEAINAALEREAPGFGGDGTESSIEGLFQVATGAGFDGDGNGSNLDSGVAGLATTQTNPGISGDVPPFNSFTPDPDNNVLPPSGGIGGVGFRPGALPIILAATDVGSAYRDDGAQTITGVDGATVPISAFQGSDRPVTPDTNNDGVEEGATIQETVSALNSLGALVIGLGTETSSGIAPREGLEAIATLTGAVNSSPEAIDSGISGDPIEPGDPLYFLIDSGVGSEIAEGIGAAVGSAVTDVNLNVDLVASDPNAPFVNLTGPQIVGEGDTASFETQLSGSQGNRQFDLQFVRAGTDVRLGAIPVTVAGEGGSGGDGGQVVTVGVDEVVDGIQFGNSVPGAPPPVAPGTPEPPACGFISGIDSDDRLFGTDGCETIDGLQGNDVLYGLSENDNVIGNQGDDQLLGNRNDDAVEGGEGNDVLYGGKNDDTVIGGAGNDVVFGDRGSDTVIGVDPGAIAPGLGEIDILTGGNGVVTEGVDVFVLGDAARPYYDSGNNNDVGFEDYASIQDYNPAEDIIQLHGGSDRYRLDVAPEGLPPGTAIYYQTGGGDESIGIVGGVSNLTFDGGGFSFV